MYHLGNAIISRVSIGEHMGIFIGKTTKLFFCTGDLRFIYK